MSESSQIAIDRLIIHKVDHLNEDSAILSDLASPVGEEVSRFLRRHIAASLAHKYTRTAAFVPPPEG